MDPEQVLLTRLENAFEHHRNDEVFTIKESVSNYLRAVAQDSETLQTPFPEAISGLRKRYLDAFKANATAKRHHVNAFKQFPQVGLNLEHQSTKPTVLCSRLELLHEQERYSKLEVLEHHVQELGELSVASAEASQSTTDPEQELASVIEVEIDPLVHDARAKLRGLELAVVRERHKAAREKDRLQSLRIPDQSRGVVTASDQLRALEAVRRELSIWLEDGLASCSTQETPNEATQAASDNQTEETLHALQETYDGYVLSRANLLNAVRCASISEPPPTGFSTIGSNQDQDHVPSVEDGVIKIEQNMSILEQEEGIRQATSYLDGLLLEEEGCAVELLQRLADESQLLPSYPILSRSAKYDKTMRAIGGKKNADKGDPIIEQTKAWGFAGDAANDTTNASVLKHLKRGNQAIDEASKSLKDMQSLRDAFTAKT